MCKPNSAFETTYHERMLFIHLITAFTFLHIKWKYLFSVYNIRSLSVLHDTHKTPPLMRQRGTDHEKNDLFHRDETCRQCMHPRYHNYCRILSSFTIWYSYRLSVTVTRFFMLFQLFKTRIYKNAFSAYRVIGTFPQSLEWIGMVVSAGRWSVNTHAPHINDNWYYSIERNSFACI